MILSNGNLDPWSVGGFLKPFKNPSLNVLIVKEGAHHYDLRGDHVNDTKYVREIRDKEVEIIGKWLKEYNFIKKFKSIFTKLNYV